MGSTPGAGPEGTPQFNNTPTTTADFNALRDLVVKRGNVRKGTTTERNAVTGDELADGLMFWDKTLKTLFVVDGGLWKPIAGIPAKGSLSYLPGVTPQADIAICERDGTGRVKIAWGGVYTSALADGSTIGQVPAGFRPPSTKDSPGGMAVGGAAGGCFVQILTGGEIVVYGITGTGNRKVSFEAYYPVAS